MGKLWPDIECWLGSIVDFQEFQTSIAKNPYIFVIFQGGGGGRLDPPMVFEYLWTIDKNLSINIMGVQKESIFLTHYDIVLNLLNYSN